LCRARRERKQGNLSPCDVASRIVLIKGPSQNVWFRNSRRYHKDLTCGATRTAHQATEIAIETTSARQYSYWLIIFPKDVVLDNNIFSKDADNVDPKWNRQTSKADENAAEMDLFSVAMMWIIGEDGGRRTSNASSKPAAKDLFKTP
jgi:hypothetical protein